MAGNPALSADRVPKVLRAAAPVSAVAPTRRGPTLSTWAKKMAQRMDIPSRALAGYASAELAVRKEMPGCHLSWVTLAGIGRTGSDHGRAADGKILSSGVMSVPLGTLPLRGADGATKDATSAIGPMQLPTALWYRWQRSARLHAKPNPQDIDDAALTTATALCSGGRDTATGDGWWASIRSLRDSDLYLQRVLANANVYGTIAQSRTPLDQRVLEAVRFAIGQIGLPYVWGGNGLKSGDQGFDCSGLTSAAYGSAGVNLPRTAHTQYHSMALVSPNELRLGDLVYYGNPSAIHHVGMYIGNGQMINAPTFGQAVQVASYRLPGDDFAGAGRPIS
jgi:cell wall-associated NlpC family hydrolase